METTMLSWQPIRYHGNQRMLLRQKKTSKFIVFRTNNRYCDSVPSPLTTAPHEGQGPSMKYHSVPLAPAPAKLGGHKSGVTQRSAPITPLKLQSLRGHCDLVRHFWPYLP